MTMSERRRAFRSILAGGACVHPASVFDPISARIAEDLGFETAMFAGSIASLTVLGAPDLVVLTLTEFADQVRRITRAAPRLPLLVDADHGYGNALNVMRTVAGTGGRRRRRADHRGHRLLPRPYGDGRARLLPLEEGLGKIGRPSRRARTRRLSMVGRTGALQAGGLDDAVPRARAYAAAGVDALFFTGVKTLDQVRALRAPTGTPIILGGIEGGHHRAALAGAGVRDRPAGAPPFLAAVRAVHETLAALRGGVSAKSLANQPSGALMKQVTRDGEYAAWVRAFLGGA